MNTQSNQPLISVIIPVYNAEEYLPRCLDSIIKQTFTAIEIICINDGSSDNSSNILTQYANKDNRIIILKQENLGAATARNLGLDHAKGKYISFIDADDWIAEDFIATLYHAATKSKADVVQCGYFKFDGIQNKTIIEKELISQNISQILDNTKKLYIWNKIWKKNFLDKNHIRYYPDILYQDILFNICTLCHQPIWQFIDYCGYFYWFNNKSSVTNTPQKQLKRRNDKYLAIKKSIETIQSSDNIDSSDMVKIENFLLKKFIGTNELSNPNEYAKYAKLFANNSLLKKKYRKIIIKQILRKLFNILSFKKGY